MLSRAVRVASHVERRQCSDVIAWCSTVLMVLDECPHSAPLRARLSRRCGPSLLRRTRGLATAEPYGRVVRVGAPSDATSRTPQAARSPAVVAPSTEGIGRATGVSLCRCSPLDVRSQLETPTLRDRWRWSYAPCGLLLALALREAVHRWHDDAARQEESIPSLHQTAAGAFMSGRW